MDHEHGKMEYIFNAWRLTSNYKAVEQLRVSYKQMLNFAITTGGNLGVMHESALYMSEYDQRVQAAGGQRTLRALGVG
jgi:ketosteroid isomerase-like protein